jgi:hypothetical protein
MALHPFDPLVPMPMPRRSHGEASAAGGPRDEGGAVTLYPSSAPVRLPKTLSRTAEVRMHARQAFLDTVNLRDEDDGEFHTVDLSLGGVGLIGSRRLGVGRAVDVVFLNRSLVIPGVIRSERESALPRWRIGIQFLQLQPELLAVASAGIASAV